MVAIAIAIAITIAIVIATAIAVASEGLAQATPMPQNLNGCDTSDKAYRRLHAGLID